MEWGAGARDLPFCAVGFGAALWVYEAQPRKDWGQAGFAFQAVACAVGAAFYHWARRYKSPRKGRE